MNSGIHIYLTTMNNASLSLNSKHVRLLQETTHTTLFLSPQKAATSKCANHPRWLTRQPKQPRTTVYDLFRAQYITLRESPDLSSQTPGNTQHGSHWLSPGYPRTYGLTSTQKGRVSPKLEGGCHSSLGSSGDISISHSGVSHGYQNVPHASLSHYNASPDSSGLCRPPSWNLLQYNGSFPQDPLFARKG